MKKTTRPSRRLPGDPTLDLKRILRVDHAGEYGAKRIYAGQLAVLKGTRHEKVLRHMAEQEQVHLDAFSGLLRQHRVRPSALQPFWHVAGFALGAMTARLGPQAAMACTVAVEEVIDQHYRDQLEQLGPEHKKLKAMIEKFRLEELEHRDIGLEHGAASAPGYKLLHGAVSAACRVAIKVAERL
jgi:ubiquinone biosynthesis monooxygenase Coq7